MEGLRTGQVPRWLLAAVLAPMGLAVLLALLDLGLVLTSEHGTHVEWVRLEDAPPGTPPLDPAALPEGFADRLATVPPGEGGMLVLGTGGADALWDAIHAAGAATEDDGYAVVLVDGVPVGFREGPLF